MKKLLLLLSLGFFACSPDNHTEEEPENPFGVQNPNNKLHYTINGKTTHMEYFYMNNVTSGGTTVVGKHIGSYADATDDSEKYSIADFYFNYNPDQPDIFELYAFEVLVWDENYGTEYTNYYFNDTLPFNHNITYQNGKLAGDFNGKVIWPHTDTLTVTGRLEFIVPEGE